MDHHSLILIISAALGFMLAWSVGANDLANVMSTALTSKAITARQAVLIAIVFEFLGAFFGGHAVTDTIRHGIINLDGLHANAIILGMTAILLSATAWMTLSSRFGMPVSITNTIIGGLIGFAATVYGVVAIEWDKVWWIAFSWLCSPSIACFFSYTLFMSIQSIIFWTTEPAQYARRYIVIYLFLVAMILSMMIAVKGLHHMPWHLSHLMNLLLVLSLGLIIFALGLWWVYQIPLIERANRREQFDYIERMFSVLMAITACPMVFAHGSNDIPIVMGPVSVVLDVLSLGDQKNQPLPYWITIIGCSGVVLGLMMYGRKVIETVGNGITALTPSRAFAATLAAATTVVVSTGTGIPVSATQTLVGGVLGVGLARGIGALNLNTIRNILLSWVVTIPSASILAVLVYALLKKCATALGLM